MGQRRSTPLQRLAQMILLLRNRGRSDEAIDAFIRTVIQWDLARLRAKHLEPSLN